MSMCRCDDWADCLNLQTVWLSRCKRVMNDAGDMEFEDPCEIPAYYEVSRGHSNDTSGRTNDDNYSIISNTPLCNGDMVWLDCPTRCSAREIRMAQPFYDPECGKIHHYEAMV